MLTQVPAHCTAPNSWADSELSAASQANAKTNLVIISGNPAHYRLLNYPINSTSWESLFATQANVCSQISRQEDSSIVQTQGFDNAERAGLVADRHREKTEECSSFHPHSNTHTHTHLETKQEDNKRLVHKAGHPRCYLLHSPVSVLFLRTVRQCIDSG